MATTLGNQPSPVNFTEILRCSVVEFSVSSSWSMMLLCDLVLAETEVLCTVQSTVRCKVKLENLVGVNVVQKPHPLNPLACQMDIHSYPLVGVGLFGKMSRKIITNSFCFHQEPTFRENLYTAVQWKKAINKQCRRAMQRVFCNEESGLEQTSEVAPPQLLVFINPFGGQGKAVELFEEHVRPMFDMAEIQSTVVVTKRQNHARDIIKSYDFSSIDGIVVSSGDGLLFEVINGIMERADWETAIRKPVGILPTGSGNGVSASLFYESNEEYSLTNAAFLIIRGGTIPIDVATVETHDGGKCYMSLAMGWGLVADVDIESEKMRSLGETRFVLGAFSCIVKKNVYSGILHYLPVEEDGSQAAGGTHQDGSGQLRGPSSTAEGGSGQLRGPSSTAEGGSGQLRGPSSTVDTSQTAAVDIAPPTVAIATQLPKEGMEEKDGIIQPEHSQDGVVEKDPTYVQCEQTISKEELNGSGVNNISMERNQGGNISMEQNQSDSNGLEQNQGGNSSMEQNQSDNNSLEQNQGNTSVEQNQGSHTVTEQSLGGANTEHNHNQTGAENHHDGNAQTGDVPVELGLSRVPCGPKLQYLPHLSQNVPSNWKTMAVDLLSFSAIMTSHLSRSFVGDLSKHIGSGELRIVTFRSEMSRFNLLKVLMGGENGKHIGLDHVMVLKKVRAFRLEVVTEPGMITVDGEAISYGTLQVELHPRVARLMCRKRRQECGTST